MKVLSFMNVSNQQSISTDSGYIFYDILAEEFSKKGFEFVFVAPKALKYKFTRHISMTFGSSKYESRFSFNWDETTQIIKNENPDIIIVNQLELLANYRAVATTLRLDCKIVGYAHCIPFSYSREDKLILEPSLNNNRMCEGILFNFISGLKMSDKVYVHSVIAKSYITRLITQFNLDICLDTISIIPPPYDPYLKIESPSLDSRKYMTYNHRINDHYGIGYYERFAKDLINSVKQEFLVLDIMGERSPERNRLDESVENYRQSLSAIEGCKVIKDGCDRTKYRQILSESFCTFAPYREAHPWSMSCIDSIGMGVPVVAPNFGWFKEIIPDELRYNNEIECIEIVRKLKHDNKFWLEQSNVQLKQISYLSPQNIVSMFYDSFITLMN